MLASSRPVLTANQSARRVSSRFSGCQNLLAKQDFLFNYCSAERLRSELTLLNQVKRSVGDMIYGINLDAVNWSDMGL